MLEVVQHQQRAWSCSISASLPAGCGPGLPENPRASRIAGITCAPSESTERSTNTAPFRKSSARSNVQRQSCLADSPGPGWLRSAPPARKTARALRDLIVTADEPGRRNRERPGNRGGSGCQGRDPSGCLKSICLQFGPGGRDQRCPLVIRQLQRHNEEPHRLEMGKEPAASFEVADAARLRPASVGQVFLAEPGSEPVAAEQFSELQWFGIEASSFPSPVVRSRGSPTSYHPAGTKAPSANLPLGFADATAIARAERRGGKVFTLDHRHFGVVAREGRSRSRPVRASRLRAAAKPRPASPAPRRVFPRRASFLLMPGFLECFLTQCLLAISRVLPIQLRVIDGRPTPR